MNDTQRTDALEPVATANGLLLGVPSTDESITVWKGVPFAAPPVGERRWQPPQPAASWEGVRVADTFGPICPQFGPAKGSFYQEEFYLEDEPHSEDCLYLNVWAAAEPVSEPRPVMVWFHGGGFVEGSGSLPSFHGDTLARKGVVLVTVNYRLGVFGYFAHPELSAESPHGASGNYGLLDQIAALRWVQDNIAAFNGDPTNVTIFGQSAGALSVFALLASPLAAGLFQRVIGQSGSPFSLRMLRTLSESEHTGTTLAAQWGASSLAELRALPVAALMGETNATYAAGGYRPTIDGWSLPSNPAATIASGAHPPVSLLVGATSDEWTPMSVGLTTDADAVRQRAAQLYGERADEFVQLYPIASDDEATRVQIASMSDSLFAGMRFWADVQRAHGQPAYLYYFDRKLPGRNSAYFGAFHSGDLYYAFNTLDSTDRPWEMADMRLADAMTSYWANFAATGDPNGTGLPHWPQYDPQTDTVMELGEQIGSIATPKAAQMAFFERDIKAWLGNS